jgi:hypothetical protein
MTRHLGSSQHVADVIKSLSLLFDPSAGNNTPVERRLSASWKSLLKIKSYEEVCPLYLPRSSAYVFMDFIVKEPHHVQPASN